MLQHPVYTAMPGMYAGVAGTSGVVHALLALAFVTFACMRKIPIEERTLREAFGPAWEEHRKATWALVPGLC